MGGMPKGVGGMPGSKDTSPVVVHAFFGALLSVVAGVVLDPFFGELLDLVPMLGGLALAFVLLNVGLNPDLKAPVIVALVVGKMTMPIQRPFFIILMGLLILGLLLPWLIDAANKAIPLSKERIESPTQYVFLIVGTIYFVSVKIYNWLVKRL